MKEYKVIRWKMGFTSNDKRLEDTLNEHARNGWKLVHMEQNSARIVLERDKNR